VPPLQYLIGATGEHAARLRQDPEDPLPLRQLIFLNRDDDIRVWFLTNSGQDPLTLMVIESRLEDGEDLDETPDPPNGRYRFSTTPCGKSGPAQKTQDVQGRRSRSGLTRTNSFRARQRGRLGRLLVLALSFATTAA